jgi:diacylglycerol kinase (ATP)
MKEKRFTLRSRLASFGPAFRGIASFLKNEHNAYIHLTLAILAIFLSIVLHISKNEWIAIILCIGLVLISEAFNSAIEKLTDLFSPEYSREARLIKDIAAGAVLLASIIALTAGLIVFIPYISDYFVK